MSAAEDGVVRLLDGGEVALRPIESVDSERLGRLFFRLSPETAYLRFFGPQSAPSQQTLQHLVNVDHDHRQALVAERDDETVGVARYDRDPERPDRAEIAIVVEDAWQGRGVGTILLARLAEDAKRHGVRVFTANVLGENQKMMRLARQLAPEIAFRIDHGEWRLEIPLAA